MKDSGESAMDAAKDQGPEKKAQPSDHLREFLRSRTPPAQRDLLALALPCALLGAGSGPLAGLSLDAGAPAAIALPIFLALPFGICFLSPRVMVLAALGALAGLLPSLLLSLSGGPDVAPDYLLNVYLVGAPAGAGLGLGLGIARKSVAAIVGGLLAGAFAGIAALVLGALAGIYASMPFRIEWGTTVAYAVGAMSFNVVLPVGISLAEHLAKFFAARGRRGGGDTPPSPDREALPGLRRILSILGGAAAVGVTIAVVCFGVWSAYVKASYAARIRALRAAGEPTVPEEDNRASLLREAMAMHAAVFKALIEEVQNDIWKAHKRPPEERWQLYKELLVPAEPALARAREALARPRFRLVLGLKGPFDPDGERAEEISLLAQQFLLSARRELDEGRPNGALAEARCCLKLGRALKDEPLFMA